MTTCLTIGSGKTNKMMTAMKKIFVLIAAFAVALSCNKIQEPVVTDTPQDNTPSSELVEMTFHAVGEATKTTLDGTSISWSTSDHINVFSGASFATNTKFDVTSVSSNSHEATFDGLGAVSPEYYALFPYQSGATITSAGVITATLPVNQAAVPGSFGPEANLSVAHVSGSDELVFKNVGALLGVTINEAGVNKVKVESIDGTALSGTATINYNGGNPTVTVTDGKNFVESAVSGTGTYYFVVFPGAHSSGFRVILSKTGYTASIKNTKAITIGRNDNINLMSIASVPTDKWNAEFTVGENVAIKGSAEDGQALAYVASSGYWNSSIQYSDVASYAYNYEIFTSLNAGEKFYFKAAGGEKFALNAAGTAVERIYDAAQAPYGAPATGIYRIRLNMPDGAAEIMQIAEVTYDLYGLDSRGLDYQGNGVWSKDNFLMRTDSYMDRYRFRVRFSDDTNQFYVRWINNDKNPTYGVTTADYFYVQPSVDSSSDHWSPCFKYQNTFEGNYTRYYCTMTLSLNNDNGHYTHAISNISDSVDASSDIIYIIGSAEAGQEMVHLRSGDYNTAMSGFGDNSALVSDAFGDYDYEIFTRLEDGQTFCFYNFNTGTFYAPTADGSAFQSIASPSDATYSISTGGAWRIRANFSTGKANIRRVDQVRTELNYDGGADGAVHVLSYGGKGSWKKDNAVIKWHAGQYGRANYSEYVVKIWFNRDNGDNAIDAWQVYGATSEKSGSPDASDDGSYWNLQPYTSDGWNRVFFYPSWTIDGSNNGRYTATISVYMNNAYGHYTHRFTNVTDTL